MGRKNAPEAPNVPLVLWRELYEAARQFQIMAPWDWMGDGAVLGIINELGMRLVCVLGAMGEVFGLASYREASGARVLLDLIHGPGQRDPDFPFVQDELLLDYVPERQLRKESKKVIEQLGFSPAPTKPRLYPQFFSHKPGYVPWFIDESEARVLLDDIRKSMRFSELMKDHPDLFEGRRSDEFPFWLESVIEPLSVEKLTWQIVSVEPSSEPAIDPKAFQLGALQAMPQQNGAVWELIAFHANMPIGEAPRPYFPRIGLGVDAGSGMFLGFELNGPDKTMAEAASAGLIQCIRTAGKRPATVRVASENLAHALRPLADSLKIKLLQVKILPMASEARRSLERFGGGS